MDKKKYVRVDPFTGFPEKDVKEDAPTTSTAGVAATGDDPTVVVRKKKKLYDGRTTVAKKFVERILKQREARRVAEEVELDEMNSEDSLKNWKHKDAKGYAEKLIEEYGQPDEVTETMLKWNKLGSFGDGEMETYVIDESIPHSFPAPHRDYVYTTMKMKVDSDMLDTLGHVTGSIIYDGLKETVTARCGSLYANAATMGFVKDMIDGKVPVEDEVAKKEYADRIQKDPLPKFYDNRMNEDLDDSCCIGHILDEVLKPKDKKVIDDFVQMNKGTGAQNFTQRGSIVDYEGRSLEKKGGMGAQQIASLESDPKDDYKIKIRAKMDGKSTQSIVNYLKKSAKKYNIKVEETVKEEPMINEKIEYVEYKFRNKNDAIKAQKYFMKQNQGPDYEFMDDDINNGTLGVDAGKDDMTKHHNEVMKKFRPKIVSKESLVKEDVANLFVKGDNPNQMALKIAKNAKGLGLKSAIMGNHVRIKGSKKQVNDFMRSVIGKSSMGSPTEKGASNPQIDKMLNKQLKENKERSFTKYVMETTDDFGVEYLLIENNLKMLQNIVKKKQNAKVKFKDNKRATVDLFTASAIMKVYDAVKPDNKKKLEKLMNGTLSDFLKLQAFAMKQVKFAW